MIQIFQDPVRTTTLRHATRNAQRAQGLDVTNSSPSNAWGEVFFLDIPFYRTRREPCADSDIPGVLAMRIRLFVMCICLWLSAPVYGQGIESNWVKIAEMATPAIAVIETEKGLGSGFFVKSDGTLITNSHVIGDAKEITVKLKNGETYRRAFILSVDEQRDLAVLRVEAADVPILPLGNSNDSKTGEEVLLVGAPRGLEQTVSNGIISGIRVLENGNRVIQTTAPASPGSSGGPLLNRQGQVIGIITFSLVGGQNLNFAIPANYAKGMLDALSLSTAEATGRLLAAPNSSPDPGPSKANGVFVVAYRTPGHQRYSTPEVFQEVVDDLLKEVEELTEEADTILQSTLKSSKEDENKAA